jgi:glycosyltransferase involved in cell wall biosynthesis
VAQHVSGWIRIVLLDQNMGAASARNAGWAVATQTFIAFLDADDAWHPEKIRIQLQYMQSQPDVVLCGHAHKILPTPAMPGWHLRNAGRHPKVKRITKWELLLSNRFVTPSVMLRRDIPQRFEERQRYMEDHMLWLNIVCAGGVVDMLALPLAAIYKRPYGQAGLSSQWWLMERGDLGNYRRLLLQSYITQLQFLGFAVYSVAKFLRRYVLYNLFAPRLK